VQVSDHLFIPIGIELAKLSFLLRLYPFLNAEGIFLCSIIEVNDYDCCVVALCIHYVLDYDLGYE